MSRRIAILLTAVFAGACASKAAKTDAVPGDSTKAATASRTSRSASNLLTAEDLTKVDYTDLYQAVQRLRPNWLIARGGTSIKASSSGGIAVYIGDSKFGDASSMKQINLSDVKEVRYMTPSEATQRFGTGVRNGAIVVTRK